MPSIHILYDPNDRIESRPEMEKPLGIKSARLSVSECCGSDDLRAVAQELATLLVAELHREAR